MKSIEKKIYNNNFIFDISGVVVRPEKSTLLVSDLHLGKGSGFAQNSELLPPYDFKDTIERLFDCIIKYKIKKVISLGDSFDNTRILMNIHDQDLSLLQKLTKEIDFIWVLGNHDQTIYHKNLINGIFLNNHKTGNFTYRHIKKQVNNNKSFEFSGHYHPKVSIKVNKMKFSYKCFVLSDQYCILPAFGTYTGGLNIEDLKKKQIIKANCNEVFVTGKSKMIKLNY